MFLLLLSGIAILGLIIWALREDARQRKESKYEQERNAFERKWQAEREAYELAKAEALAELEAQWGKCVKEIYLSHSKTFTLEDRVYVFEESEKIILEGKVLDFKDIIGFALLKDSKTILSNSTTISPRKDLGDIALRVAAGHVISGSTGAIIGALSAEDDMNHETSYDMEADVVYKIYINIDSISDPTISLDFDSSEEDAYETANLLNVIINRNNRK